MYPTNTETLVITLRTGRTAGMYYSSHPAVSRSASSL